MERRYVHCRKCVLEDAGPANIEVYVEGLGGAAVNIVVRCKRHDELVTTLALLNPGVLKHAHTCEHEEA